MIINNVFRILFKDYAGHHGNGIKTAIGASFLQGYIDQLDGDDDLRYLAITVCVSKLGFCCNES